LKTILISFYNYIYAKFTEEGILSRIINRRDALKTAAAASLAGAMFPMFGARASEKRPNIIFILTDDHRHDAFGFMDKPWLNTPNMDRLASEGVQFTNSFVTTSLCSPARASFLTGKHARCHGVMNNNTPWNDNSVTFLEMLQKSGYDTGFIGKWHMPGGKLPEMVTQGKLDRMVSFTHAFGQGVYYDCPMVIDGQKTKTKGYITDVLTDYAMEFLENPRKNPFCLMLSHKAVHAYFKPAKRHKGSLKNAPLPKLQKMTKELPLGIINGQQRVNYDKYVQRYYEALLAVDDSVGTVMDYLDEKGIAENTIVVYAGDNGYFWGEHGLTDKRYAYEEGIKIPHLMRYPGVIPEGSKVDEMLLNIDLMPTLLSAAGIETPSDVQGQNCMDLACGKDVPWRKSWMYEYFEDPNFPNPHIKAVRTKDWKLIRYSGEKNELADEMYNIGEDPKETNDLIDDAAYSKKKNELMIELERLDKEIGC
jgi:arylsulfatase A-like enzyme